MHRIILAAVLLAIGSDARGQAPSATSLPGLTQPMGAAKRSEALESLRSRVEKLEKSDEKAVPAWIAFYAVIIAAIIAGALALIGQFWNAKKQRELDQQKARFDQAQRLLEFRLKQLEFFYAPLFASLEQSKALYDKLLYQLSRDESHKYRLLEKPDANQYRMYVMEGDDWKPFRLLDKLPAVRTNPKALNLVEQILSIGARMTEIIAKNAGLASVDLLPLLGQYMAHYTILSTMHQKGETEPYPSGWHTMGYYPHELNDKVAQGYRDLNEFLNSFVEASRRVINELAS
jgi:hypothetical protein